VPLAGRFRTTGILPVAWAPSPTGFLPHPPEPAPICVYLTESAASFASRDLHNSTVPDLLFFYLSEFLPSFSIGKTYLLQGTTTGGGFRGASSFHSSSAPIPRLHFLPQFARRGGCLSAFVPPSAKLQNKPICQQFFIRTARHRSTMHQMQHLATSTPTPSSQALLPFVLQCLRASVPSRANPPLRIKPTQKPFYRSKNAIFPPHHAHLF